MLAPLSSAYRQLPVAICRLGGISLCAIQRVGVGQRGYQVITLIAADKLTPVARAEVAALLGGDARDSIESASTWADYIRLSHPETAPWHYVNIEVSVSGYNAATDCPADNCVVAQVQKDAPIVADHQLAKPVRAEALRFLIPQMRKITGGHGTSSGRTPALRIVRGVRNPCPDLHACRRGCVMCFTAP